MANKLENYLKLFSLSYDEAVNALLKKYGGSQYDYFSKKSYEKFLEGQTVSIPKGKFTRTKEGLYCHHIDENKYMNLSNLDFISNQKPPYDVQKKERLVYCDLNEHVILHALISKETDFKFGNLGLNVFLIPNVIDWYINKIQPNATWEKNCFETAFLTVEDAEQFISEVKLYLE